MDWDGVFWFFLLLVIWPASCVWDDYKEMILKKECIAEHLTHDQCKELSK